MTPPDTATPEVPPGLVKAVWRGPFVADMGPGTLPLNPGEESLITPDHAASDHWECDEDEVAAAHAHLATLVEQQPVLVASIDPPVDPGPDAPQADAPQGEPTIVGTPVGEDKPAAGPGNGKGASS